MITIFKILKLQLLLYPFFPLEAKPVQGVRQNKKNMTVMIPLNGNGFRPVKKKVNTVFSKVDTNHHLSPSSTSPVTRWALPAPPSPCSSLARPSSASGWCPAAPGCRGRIHGSSPRCDSLNNNVSNVNTGILMIKLLCFVVVWKFVVANDVDSEAISRNIHLLRDNSTRHNS